MKIGDRVGFKPRGDEQNPNAWRYGVIVKGGGGPHEHDHCFVRYDDTGRTNATAYSCLFFENATQLHEVRNDSPRGRRAKGSNSMG